MDNKPQIDFEKLKQLKAPKKTKEEQYLEYCAAVEKEQEEYCAAYEELLNKRDKENKTSGHEVKIVENDVAFYRWECSCGVSSAGQWYSSSEKAMKRANAHKSSALTDPYYNRRGLINVRDFDEWP